MTALLRKASIWLLAAVLVAGAAVALGGGPLGGPAGAQGHDDHSAHGHQPATLSDDDNATDGHDHDGHDHDGHAHDGHAHGGHTGHSMSPGETGSSLQQVTISGAWVRPARAGETSAIYFSITNPGPEDVEIVHVETEAAEVAEVHETVAEVQVVGGRLTQEVRMEHVHALVVHAGETVQLRPGGLHVMLIGLKKDLEEGQTVNVRLVAADGSQVEVTALVSQGEPRG